MTKEKINHAKTSFYQTKKSRTITAFTQALSAGVSASQTARKNGVTAISQKAESSNSAFAVSFQKIIVNFKQSFKNMHITTVSVEYRRKFNIGNYESLELGISLYTKVDADEEAEAVAELLWQQAKASVKAQATPVLKGVNYQAQVKHKESWAAANGNEDEF